MPSRLARAIMSQIPVEGGDLPRPWSPEDPTIHVIPSEFPPVGYNLLPSTSSLRPYRLLTAREILLADILNPMPNDHKGRKDHNNEPSRHELYLLAPGEKKVIEEPDTSKWPNSFSHALYSG